MTVKLSSQWGGLSPLLLATFWPVDYDGKRRTDDDFDVVAPIVEGGNFSIQANWQSPFENMGPESKAPAITALVQSGALLPLVSSSGGGQPPIGRQSALVNSLFENVGDGLSDLRGASGVTKINSNQIFSGMPPGKFSLSVLFRAYANAYDEVELPLRKLQSWAAPIQLADAGAILGSLGDFDGVADRGFLKSILPSTAPTLIAMRYGNMMFNKLVIESIEEPITSPRGKDGYYTECVVALSISTLAALDRQDLKDAFTAKA